MTVEHHPARDLQDVVHQRTRLGIMAMLCEVKRADFATIRSTLELTAGNLSQHLSVLENAELIVIEKTFEGKKARTWVKVTSAGKRAFRAELEALRALIARSDAADKR